MNLFLDTSVVLAACMSATGASREVFHLASRQGWQLLVSPWILRETRDNLVDKPTETLRAWATLRGQVTAEGDELAFDWPLTFAVTKDKPVLLSALACADARPPRLRSASRPRLVYGLRVRTPGAFLQEERQRCCLHKRSGH